MLEVLDLVLGCGLQGRRIPGIVLKLALGWPLEVNMGENVSPPRLHS